MRQLRVLVIAILVAAGLAAASAPSSTAAPAPAPAPAPWTVASYFSRLGVELNRISCSSAAHCTAIEAGLLLTTADGGATWTDETALVPADAAELTDVNCPTDTRCYLAAVVGSGTAVVYVVDGGALSITSPVGAAGLLPTLDCTAADACFTTDGSSLFQTTDGGATWTARALATALEPVATVQARFNADFAGRATALSCAPGTVRCAVLGNVGVTVVAQYTADAGRHWTTQTLSGNTSHPNGKVSVDCVSSTTCFALTAAPYDPTSIVVTSDGGGSWHGVSSNTRPPGWVVSCGAPTSCVSVAGGEGSGFDVNGASTTSSTSDSGATWTPAGGPAGPAAVHQPAVACPTASACVVVADGSADRSADGGATWTTVELPTAVRAVQDLSCATPTTCVGVEWLDWAHHVAVRGAPGGPWTRTELPTTPQAALRDLACPSAKVCMASALPAVNADQGGPGEVVSTVDGGVTWTTGGPIDIAATDLSCPTATTCLASTNYIHRVRVTTNGGRTWAKVAAPPDVKIMLAVSCSSTTSCVALGTSGRPPASTVWTTADLGATWVRRDGPHGGGDVDCNGNLCVVSADAAHRISHSTDGGTTWSSVPGPSGIPYGLFQVSCGSPTSCAMTGTDATGTDATGNQFAVSTRDAGSSWQVHSLPPQLAHPYPILSNVSCTRTACFVAGTDPYGRPTLFTGKA